MNILVLMFITIILGSSCVRAEQEQATTQVVEQVDLGQESDQKVVGQIPQAQEPEQTEVDGQEKDAVETDQQEVQNQDAEQPVEQESKKEDVLGGDQSEDKNKKKKKVEGDVTQEATEQEESAQDLSKGVQLPGITGGDVASSGINQEELAKLGEEMKKAQEEFERMTPEEREQKARAAIDQMRSEVASDTSMNEEERTQMNEFMQLLEQSMQEELERAKSKKA
ncbi:MAG: hypothetical protein H6679_04725 [Epsilonproteobacteria bacterium]|nr:hypothetical protein [Campylobacterota bacterium]